MPKFFFHFSAAGSFVGDAEGKELAHLAEAHDHALRLVEQATSYFEDARDWRGWTVRISGASGRSRRSVLFPHRAQASVSRSRIA